MFPSPLDRKLLRDLRAMRGQALAISAVVASGIALFVMSMSLYHSLKRSQEAYYEKYRFAHVFAVARRAPEALARRLAEIPGVGLLETRVVSEVIVDVPGMAEPATGRLISIPDRGRPRLNDLHLRAGRFPEARGQNEALVGEGFARAHGLAPGDSVAAVINGRWQRLRITGTALSPEFIYQVRPGDLAPDEKTFGIFWMRREALAAALDMEGAFDDVVMRLEPGANLPEVLERTDRILERYGGVGAFGREQQISNRFITDEIAQLRNTAVIIPSIFLSVAAFLVGIVLHRLVATQRTQIAALKALGYDDLAVGAHFLKLVLAIVLLGGAAGTVAGTWMGRGMVSLYIQFFHLPDLHFELRASVVIGALLIAVATAFAGGIAEMRRVMRLPPAEAMRPEPPQSYRPTVLERMGFERVLSQPGRIVLRNLERRPLRAAMSVAAMAMGVAILVIGLSQEDGVQVMIDSRFVYAQLGDATVAFVNPRSRRALHELQSVDGVMRAEPYRVVAATLRSAHRTYDSAVTGLEAGGELFRLVDQHLRVVRVPEHGIVISKQLGRILRVSPGDTLTLQVKEASQPRLEVPVAGFLDELLGVGAYMRLESLNASMREGDVISGAYVALDPQRADAVYRRLKATPLVASVTLKKSALESIQKTIGDTMGTVRVVQIFFAAVIAFGVVYNAARIAVSERGRELATLRVIGFTRTEISFILVGELALLTAIAIPAGWGIGYQLEAMLVEAFQTDLYRIPLVVSRQSFAGSALVVALSAAVSALAVRRKLDALDLVAVLKASD